MRNTMTKNPLTLSMILASFLSLFLAGCADMGFGSADEEMASPAPISGSSTVYTSSEFSDLQIPTDLEWDRDKSLVIHTESFAGGVLRYSGRIEVNSLADFFATSMTKNGWRLVGTAKYKNVLLAFVKENKTCTITIGESDLRFKTEVHIYITEDITGRKSPF